LREISGLHAESHWKRRRFYPCIHSDKSKESFAKAAENAVAEAAKTVRGLKWARVAELEMELDGKKIAQYRATTKIYFKFEH
jgi:flavin-binding protein dodecin